MRLVDFSRDRRSSNDDRAVDHKCTQVLLSPSDSAFQLPVKFLQAAAGELKRTRPVKCVGSQEIGDKCDDSKDLCEFGATRCLEPAPRQDFRPKSRYEKQGCSEPRYVPLCKDYATRLDLPEA